MKKDNLISRKSLLLCMVAGLSGCARQGIQAQEPYRFTARDYVSTDDQRAPQSSFSYDDEQNTFTITASGTNNIAFQMDMQKDGAYYIEQTQDWFLVQGTGLSTETGQSYIWWFNGYNGNGNQTPPTHSVDNGDGTKLILWDIRNTESINANMDYGQPILFISSNGKNFIHAMGLTSTDGESTISNIAYYARYEAAATYPSLIPTLGFTEESLTDELKRVLSQTIAKAGETIAGDAESEGKQQVQEAIKEAQGICDTAGNTEYAKMHEALKNLRKAMEDYEGGAASYAYERTPHGIYATLGRQHIQLVFYGEDIVRVVKSYDGTATQDSLSVVAAPVADTGFEVSEDEDAHAVTVSTSKLRAVCHLATGQVEILRYNGAELLREKEGGTLFLPFKDGPYDSYQISNTFLLDEDEQIFGMGQIQDGKLNRRGQTFSLQQDNMKVCIPYFQSTKNYALFWDNSSPTTFTDNENGTRFQSTGRKIDYYVLVGDESADVLAAMRRLTGHSPMPPLWNFGLYQSKERYTSTDEVMQVVDEYRRLGVPLDCIVQDWQYWGDNAHWNALSFLNPAYANAQEMIDHVHGQHAKLMISIWANFGPQTEPYAELDAKGRLIPVESYPQNCGVHPYDVYGESARDIYWKHLYNGLVSKGIDAYWMDSTEPDYFNWKPSDLNYVTETGQTWRALRNAFPLAQVGGVATHHREAEAQGDPYLQGKRVSILTRSAFAGQQRYGADTWSGDVTASWANFAAQIPAACNLSVCGIPYWNSDIGGFFTGSFNGVDDPSWRRLYMRWMQFGTFTPMMRFHGTNTPREIYQFGSEGDGLGDFDQILKYVRMRYRMLPYLYSTAWQVSRHDRAFMQALAVAFNRDRDCYGVTDEYMFGDAFLVAPVVRDAMAQRDVYLPAGEKWTDFWTGERHEGGQTVVKKAQADIIPLYVKAGSILPWGPDVQYSTERNWDNLEIRVYPGADGSFTLYEDENDNYNYEKGKYSEIPFSWNEAAQTLTIGERQGAFDGMPARRVFRICKVSARRGIGDAHETRHEAIVEYDGTAVSVKLESEDRTAALTDLTALYIENPSFEDDNMKLEKTAPRGWTVDCSTSWWGVNPGGGNGDPVASDGNYIFGVWDGTNSAQAEISQDIGNLPQGQYRLTVDMHASNKNSMMRVGRQRLFANEAVALFRDQVTAVGNSDMQPLQTVSLDFTVADGDRPVTIGVATSDAQDETWFKIDNFRLYAVERPLLTLDEDSAYVSTAPGMTDAVLLREFKAGQWHPICVPFSLDEEETAAHFKEVRELSSVIRDGDGYSLDFTKAPRVEAGMPYLVQVPEETANSVFRDALVRDGNPQPVRDNGVTFSGTFEPRDLHAGEYFIAGDRFHEADTPVALKAYHAYVTIDGDDGAGAANLTILIDGKPIGITHATATGDAQTADVFSLSGIRLRQGVEYREALRGLPKGVYVVNGKKVVK